MNIYEIFEFDIRKSKFNSEKKVLKNNYLNLYSPNDRCRYALVTLYTANIKKWGKISAKNIARYAQKYNYPFYCFRESLNKSMHPVWSKVLCILALMIVKPNHEWILWIDADALIIDDEISLEEIFDDIINTNNIKDDELTLIISRDICRINFGVFFIRNDIIGRKLLIESLKREDCFNHILREQEAVRRLLFGLGDDGKTVENLKQRELLTQRTMWMPQKFLNNSIHPLSEKFGKIIKITTREKIKDLPYPKEIKLSILKNKVFIVHLAGIKFKRDIVLKLMDSKKKYYTFKFFLSLICSIIITIIIVIVTTLILFRKKKKK